MGLAVGIDLGTTNSVVAISQGGRPRVLATPDGNALIPSMVSFHPNGQTIVGAAARARRPIDPTNTVFSVKRLLGRPFQSEEVRRAKTRFAFELREGPDTAVLVHTRVGDLSLPEISAFVLREIRRIGEAALGETIDRAVVTVPANFNELQRTATKIAGQIADLDVIRILNEPTAAALAYGYGRGSRERVAVYDFGGGTFDVTLLELSGNVFEVLATAGDTFLGGDDIDLLVTENLADALLQAHRIDARQDHRSYELLRAAAEQAKIDLSSTDTATIRIPEIGYAAGGRPLEFRTRITRAELEALAAPLVNRTFEVCTEALKLAQMRPGDCNTVILVGGSSRIPAVREGVAKYFGKDPLTTLPPEQVVGMGAAILAEALTGSRKANAPAVAARPRTQTLKPPVPEPGRSQPPPSPGSPSQRPGAPALRGGTLPGTRPQATPGRPITGPAIRPRPTDDETTSAVLQRGRSITNPGISPHAIPNVASDLTWGSNRPPAGPGADEATNVLRAPSRPGLPVTDEGLLDGEPTSSFDLRTTPGFDESTRPRAQLPPMPVTLPDIPASLLPPLDLEGPDTHPGTPVTAPIPGTVQRQPPPFGAQAVGVRTAQMPVAVAPPTLTPFEPMDFPSPPNTPGDSLFSKIPGADRSPGGATAAPGPSPRTATQAFAGIPPHEPPSFAEPGASSRTPSAMMQPAFPANANRMPSSAPGAMPGAPSSGGTYGGSRRPSTMPPTALPGAPRTGNTGMRAMPGVSARAPSVPPGHLGLPSIPPPQLPLLLDVTPHTLSVETVGGMCETVIARNATIPVEQAREFATAVDGQETVRIRIAQGESRRFGENQALGELELSGISRAPRGEVKISVTFELDADGTLHVRARELATGRETATRVTLLTMPTAGETAAMAQRQRTQA